MCSNESPNGPAAARLFPEAAAAAAAATTGPRTFLHIDQYRLQLYQYAVAERLRYPLLAAAGGPFAGSVAAATGAPLTCYPALFPRAVTLHPEEPKPQHSYIGLIAMAILSSPEGKLVLSDIYQHILDHYPYFRSRGPGWRNSIRHNLSLNDCFIKAGRSANGKGHYWAIHPANVDDFRKGDFRRRKAQRKVRKHMGLAVDEDGADSPSPPPLSPPVNSSSGPGSSTTTPGPQIGPLIPNTNPTITAMTTFPSSASPSVTQHPGHHHHHHQHNHHHNQAGHPSNHRGTGGRRRQFDVASLLAPDSGDESCADEDIIDVVSAVGGGETATDLRINNHQPVSHGPNWGNMFPIVNYYQALLQQARPLSANLLNNCTGTNSSSPADGNNSSSGGGGGGVGSSGET